MASASGKDTSAQITLSVNDTEILQDEALPAMTVTARCPEGQQELLLEESSGYRVKDLVQRLNMGDGVSLTCEADGKKFNLMPRSASAMPSVTNQNTGTQLHTWL